LRNTIIGLLTLIIGTWTADFLAAQPPNGSPPGMQDAAAGQSNGAQPPDVQPPNLGSNGEQPGQGDSDSSGSFWGILVAGGPVGMLIVLLSVAAMALVIEHMVTIRAPILMPPGLDEEVHALLAAGQPAQAQERCRTRPGFLSYVLGAGLAEVDGGWPAIEKAMEDATVEQSSRLFRKIEYLSVIGNIAPMMGLLGTVIGMIFAFRELSDSQGAPRAADLAEGIYLALITTVEGLIVAIPSLAAFAVFRNRVDHLVAEVTYVAQHVMAPLKRGRTRASVDFQAPPPPPPAGGKH
jgi:biopolymer transport protein ExbB